MQVIIGSDHAGYSLKEQLIPFLVGKGYAVNDLGPESAESTDYPLFAKKVCAEVLASQGLGILICGTGIGMSMVANKVPGIRAALCTSEFQARFTRLHNNANVLCLGERVTGPGLACEIVLQFLTNEFEGGRHSKRLEMF